MFHEFSGLGWLVLFGLLFGVCWPDFALVVRTGLGPKGPFGVVRSSGSIWVVVKIMVPFGVP